MGKKKIDIKTRSLIENCVASKQRAFFTVLGQKARDQVVLLFHILQQNRDHIKLSKPSILWCYKKDHGFSFICNKAQRMLKKKYSGNHCVSEEDCYDHFLASSDIRFCHYSDTTSVLGQTFGMLVIQDFESITPNILARIIECVEGGGLITIILPNVQSFEEIASLKMDAHSRYVTAAHSEVHPMFNFRFLMSLSDCKNCIVLDDNHRILLLPNDLCSISSSTPLVEKKMEHKLLNGDQDTNSVLNKISALCCTEDQVNALQSFIGLLKKDSANSVVSLTSARGRGKSAALGLAISSALYLKYSNVYVTSPQIDNLKTVFSFIIKGMEMFDCKEGRDYSLLFHSIENSKLICGINMFHDRKQVVKYLNPTEFSKAEIADLVVIDEAAAIPLHVVKNWLNAGIVFMASTINGYEGTGRSLSLKLMNQLRRQSLEDTTTTDNSSSYLKKKNVKLHEITLNEAIRYADGDNVEAWLNNLFCLDTEISYFNGDVPNPELCQLYYVNKNVLFSYQNVAEKFLQQLVALFVSSHYKNCPNDLLMMADAPSHHIFCLLPPVDENALKLPNVLCVIQVALEGKISKESCIQELSHGKRASGDLVPWIISQQFQDNGFPMLSGARIVRIATHPDYQRMGYGQQALRLLFSHYQDCPKTLLKCADVKKEKHVLLLKLSELEPEKLDYIGVSYGLTLELLKFWEKMEFVPLYLRQTSCETTGEHSCIMVKSLSTESSVWLSKYSSDFMERFVILLTTAFRSLSGALALKILHYKKKNPEMEDINSQPVLSECSIKRLEAYCNHLVDYHLIMDLMPILSRSYFLYHFRDFFLSSIQETVLLCMGLQNKTIEEVALELNVETNQVMGLFKKIVRKILHHLNNSFQNCKKSQKDNFSSSEDIQYLGSFSETVSSKRKQANFSSEDVTKKNTKKQKGS